jgi:hypothetical protein
VRGKLKTGRIEFLDITSGEKSEAIAPPDYPLCVLNRAGPDFHPW